jgi:outer membrane lipase/esterase
MLRPRYLACAVALALASSAFVAQATPAVQPAATSSSTTHAGLFDNMVVFGDSLSDDGNVSLAEGLPGIFRWTTNPGQTGLENVADFFGTPMTPALAGGTDFAFGGAGIVNNDPSAPPGLPTLPAQLGMYLTATSGKADPNTLYAVWGGANDIFYNAYAAALGALTPAQAQANLITAAGTELDMIHQLGTAGARYVMVVNLPNIGITPDAAAQGPAAAAQLTGLSLTFNNALNAGLASTGVNIIPVNAFAFLNEVVANPSAYGFTNVTTPACTGSAFGCLPAGTPGATSTYQPGTQDTYLFADGVHPTTAAHAMLAQYAESIILAPGQMSLLGEAPLAINASLNRSITTQATTSLASAPGNGLRLWANYDYARQRLDAQVNSPKSDNDVNTLSFGADLHPSDAVTAGLAFTVGQNKASFAGNMGSFKLQDMLATGYVMWGWQQAYFGAIGSFGHLSYSNIQRNIPIGPTVRQENGDTSGSHEAFTLTGGWWLDFGDWRTGPFADVGWQSIQVNAFNENGNDATTMTFGKQNRHALIGTLGWQLNGNLKAGAATLHPYARVAWNHDSDADADEVTAGLVSMPGQFTLPGFAADRNWGSVGVGLAADFAPGFSGWIGYDGRFSDSSQRVNSLNIGAKFKF